MSPRKTPTRLAHSLRFQRFACTALIGLFVGPLLTDRVCGAEEPADSYDVLYDVIVPKRCPYPLDFTETRAGLRTETTET